MEGNTEDNSLKIFRHLQTTPLQIDVIILEEDIAIKQLMSLSPGSVLTFNRSVKEPAFLTVNKKKVAKGTVVQSGEYYGLKIDEILV